jgi:hypothetical protein
MKRIYLYIKVKCPEKGDPMRLLSVTIALFLVANALAFNGRNQSLRDIPDRTWMQVCSYTGQTSQNGGVSEVPWAYDANSRVFVRVGGCTGGYTNSTGFFDMGTETQTVPWTMDVSSPPTRPGGGCNRGTCYDPVTKCIYTAGGASSGPCYGTYGYWKGDMATRTWTQVKTGASQQAQCAADTANKIIITTYGPRSFCYCTVYDPAQNTLVFCPPKPDTTATQVFFPIEYWQALEYTPGLDGTMYVGYMREDTARGYPVAEWVTWLFDGSTRAWQDLDPTGLEAVAYGRPVLSYDPVSGDVLLLVNASGGPKLFAYNGSGNAWTRLSVSGPTTSYPCQMFEYDIEHNVHVLVGLTSSYGGSVWAFRYLNDNTRAAERVTGIALGGPRLECFPNPCRAAANIAYGISRDSWVRLSVYDVQGRLTDLLVSGQQSPGLYFVPWTKARAGNYIIKLKTGEEITTRRLLVVK